MKLPTKSGDLRSSNIGRWLGFRHLVEITPVSVIGYLVRCVVCLSICEWALCLGPERLCAKEPIDAPDERETPELILKMRRPLPHGFTYSQWQDGTLFVVSFEDQDGKECGSTLMWRPRQGGELVDIGSLSSLDEVLRTQVSRLGKNPDQRSILDMVVPALGEYIKLQAHGFLLDPEDCARFLAQMKVHVTKNVYESVKKRLVYPSSSCSGSHWMVAMLVRRADGAIELDRFSGSLDPFSIGKRETEIIAEVGLIPNFVYVQPECHSD